MTIYEKLLEVQKEIGAIKKEETNPFFKSKYFDINGLLAAVKPVLNKHGLVLTQGLTNLDGKLALETTIGFGKEILDTQKSAGTFMGKNMFEGDAVSYTCPLPESSDAQKAGSAITYFRRYALQSLLALEAEDDDGNSAKPVVSVFKQPVAALAKSVKEEVTYDEEVEQLDQAYENALTDDDFNF